jgi:hypothetical protein
MEYTQQLSALPSTSNFIEICYVVLEMKHAKLKPDGNSLSAIVSLCAIRAKIATKCVQSVRV